MILAIWSCAPAPQNDESKRHSLPDSAPDASPCAGMGAANAQSLGRSHLCHCEERSDEAISSPSRGDCFAALAMTYRAVLSNDVAFALRHFLWFLVIRPDFSILIPVFVDKAPRACCMRP